MCHCCSSVKVLDLLFRTRPLDVAAARFRSSSLFLIVILLMTVINLPSTDTSIEAVSAFGIPSGPQRKRKRACVPDRRAQPCGKVMSIDFGIFCLSLLPGMSASEMSTPDDFAVVRCTVRPPLAPDAVTTS